MLWWLAQDETSAALLWVRTSFLLGIDRIAVKYAILKKGLVSLFREGFDSPSLVTDFAVMATAMRNAKKIREAV